MTSAQYVHRSSAPRCNSWYMASAMCSSGRLPLILVVFGLFIGDCFFDECDEVLCL